MLLPKVFLWTTTIHPGVFVGRTLWADSVFPRMNTYRIGENLVVNYKGCSHFDISIGISRHTQKQ